MKDNFISTVLDNIGSVNIGNALKIKKYLKLTATDDGMELSDFFDDFISECSKRAYEVEDKQLSQRYSKMVCITMRAKRELKSFYAVKQNIFDMWLFDILELVKNA
jgi:hypothetical protein